MIKGGSKRYVDKIIAEFKDKIRLSTPVKNVKRDNDLVTVSFGLNGENEEDFDAVVFATHSDQSLALLEHPTKDEVEILGSIIYQNNDAVLHFDDTILPKRKTAWSSWNYLLDQDQSKPVALTYNMNILQGIVSSKTFCVTLNTQELIDPEKVIKYLNYEHPLFTLSSLKAQEQKSKISGKNNTYYCGAYWHNGFHEDGVVSALDVCSHFGEKL